MRVQGVTALLGIQGLELRTLCSELDHRDVCQCLGGTRIMGEAP